jgi:NAD(P)-dependent dehydrogenase (short-subunit alcohol dehydrogenase family)
MTETVLITGCSSGIGRATAACFLEEEWSVWATARDVDDLAGLADDGCRTRALDVTDGDRCEAVVEEILSEDGRIDALVNNAGYAQYGPIEDVPTDRVHAQFDVNVYGPHRLTRAVLPSMRQRGDGTIVNVSSLLGRVALPGNGVYSASKHALEAMSDALRAEVDEFGVDVVLVEPGPVDTPFESRALDSLEDTRTSEDYEWLYDAYEDASMLARSSPFTLEPADVATAIVDAASVTDPDPRYLVGPVAKFHWLARLLPGRARDAAFKLVGRFVRN